MGGEGCKNSTDCGWVDTDNEIEQRRRAAARSGEEAVGEKKNTREEGEKGRMNRGERKGQRVVREKEWGEERCRVELR